MRYLVAAICISVTLLACEDRDPVVGDDSNGEQRTEEGEQRTEEGEQQTEEGEQQTGEDEQQPEEGGQQTEEGGQQTEEGEQQTEEDEQQPEEDEQQTGEDGQQPEEGGQRTEEGDRAQLMAMRQEIDDLVGDAEGASIADCRYAGLGSKPCGGPWEYIVYSVSSTDSTALAGLLSAYEAFEAEMNGLYGYVSDCSVPNTPVLVYKNGRCGTE